MEIVNPTFRCPADKGIKPVWNKDCEILMLGSITAVDGMRKGFYYASERNQFWALMDYSLGKNEFMPLKEELKNNYLAFKNQEISLEIFEQTRQMIAEKFSDALLRNKIAICDVFSECYFNNNSSLDDDIILNNSNYPAKYSKEILEEILHNSDIKTVVANSIFVEKQFKKMNIHGDFSVIKVMSPSPRSGKIEKKYDSWKSVFANLNKEQERSK